ncbi:hypothetical protein [Saccharopolyspora rosea]|uniref:Uncharacterized protein n=1 Tax=Saccharopolyspora rosea TaxID=524884 RepID=A0ABW3FQP8_9PSEU|nr:hypothetical protein [Saccharopolyspora rosea]
MRSTRFVERTGTHADRARTPLHDEYAALYLILRTWYEDADAASRRARDGRPSNALNTECARHKGRARDLLVQLELTGADPVVRHAFATYAKLRSWSLETHNGRYGADVADDLAGVAEQLDAMRRAIRTQQGLPSEWALTFDQPLQRDNRHRGWSWPQILPGIE